MRTILFTAVAAMAAAFLATGCEFTTEDNLGTVSLADLQGVTSTNNPSTPSPTNSVVLPTNPTIPANPSGSSAQLWYFGYKSYDNTFRIRWPTYFATALGVGKGSYTMVAGQKAGFRSYDTDNGAKRPSYTIDGPKSRFSGTVTCILYSSHGQALAWFKANSQATTQGRLP
jgi:hypothetical protein